MADDKAYYMAARIPVGKWSALYLGDRRSDANVGYEVGQVEVFENQVTPFDFVLLGERKLTGAFTIKDEPEIGLRLELYTKSSDRLAGRGWAKPSYEALRQKEKNPDNLPDPEGRPPPDPSGYFCFAGLEPGPYVLRIVMGTDETGAELYVEREYDLFESDVTFEQEVLTNDEFIIAMLRRRGIDAHPVDAEASAER
jgi:hypothetical protein